MFYPIFHLKYKEEEKNEKHEKHEKHEKEYNQEKEINTTTSGKCS